MRRVTAAIGAAAFVVATVGVFAQAKPSFAGKWTRDAGEGAAAGGGGGRGGGRGGFGQEMTVTQDAKMITIEYTQGQNPVKLTYTIGGESKNTMPGRGGAGQEVTSKTAWEGNTLVITTTVANGGERKQVLSLDAGKLVVETTQPGREGGAMTSKVTYTKGS